MHLHWHFISECTQVYRCVLWGQRWMQEGQRSAHVVELNLGLVLVLFLQVPGQLVQHSPAAAPVGTEGWRTADLARLLIWEGRS